MSGQQAAVLERERQGCAAVDRLIPARREDLLKLEAQVAARVLAGVGGENSPELALRCAGRTVMAVPLDTRRFVRAMARYLSFN